MHLTIPRPSNHLVLQTPYVSRMAVCRKVTKSLIQTVMGILGLCIIDPLMGMDMGFFGSR